MNHSNISLMRNAMLLLAVAVLAGCVSGQYLHDEGLALMDEGKTEEGLAKLQEAVKADPNNVSYRASLARNREQVINRALVNAYNDRVAGHADAAQSAYRWVLKIDPRNARAKDGLAALEMDKRHAVIIDNVKLLIQKGDLAAAGDALKPVLQENPEHDEALSLKRKIEELIAKEQSAGPALMAKFKKPVTLEFRDANVKMVFEALSRVSGINVLLDKDVRPDLKTSIFVKNASVEDTIDLIMLQNQLEKKILNDSTVFIYPKTAEKSKEYQELQVRSFHLTNADPKQMVSMIKTLLKTKDIFVNEKTNSVIMRDTPDAINLAEKMVSDQDIPDPEVMMEVEVLEVSRARLDQLGINWPNTMTLTAGGGGAGAATTLGQLQKTNRNTILVSPAMAVTLDLMMQDSDTNILASPRIRARNHEKAKIMVGDRVPVITNAVTPLSTGSQVVTGSVSYLDVGLKLEVEPDIHNDNEVAIKVNMDVSTITNTIQNASGTVAYAVGTRNASTQLQLKDGETQILAGLIDNESRTTTNRVPGLGQLPILSHLFSDQGDNNKKTEIVLSITPHIIGKTKIPDARETKYWSGTEATLRDGQLMLKPIGTAVSTVPSGAVAPSVQLAVSTPLSLSWQGPAQAKVGDKIGLTLNAQSAQGLDDLGLLVNYDPAVFRVVDVVEGNLLKHNNSQSRFVKSIDQTNGQATIDVAAIGQNGAAGSGSVITVVLEATAAAPQSRITLSRVSPKGTGGQELAYAPPAPFTLTVSP